MGGGTGGRGGVGENSRFQQIWKLAQKLPPAGLLFTAANAQEYIWLFFVCCIWSYFLVGHIFCVVFGHIFFLDIFSFLRAISLSTYLYDIIKLATSNKATRLFLNKKVQRPDLIEGDIDL